ncbi:MAG: septum formation protein Maf [Deltaproteobacteria bacterium]|nr:septum formation protein Maf [Deltaproteobacteria bacterium]
MRRVSEPRFAFPRRGSGSPRGSRDDVSPISAERPLVLASASPRRHEILTTLRIPFRAVEAAVDETLRPGEDPNGYGLRLAAAKAERVARMLDAEGARETWVLGADTVVALGGMVLAKPIDDTDNARMIRALSGRRHDVTTAFALRDRARRETLVWQTTTSVAMRCLDEDDIRKYVATGEGRDKAGGYAAQGIASGFITEIRGSFSNVVGLPAADVVRVLLDRGALEEFPV